MALSNFNLRGLPSEVMAFLRHKAKEEHISINLLILQLVEQGIGFRGKKLKTMHHDLDFLAGTWTEKEGQIFEEKIKAFEKVDEELWL